MPENAIQSATDNFLARYQKLNPEQKKAVDTIDGPVLVIAGPGSGKTELLSLRVANILRITDTPPSSILCLTFTDAAAANMRKRLAGLIGQEAYKVAIHTFHSFGSEIINHYPEYFYEGAFYKPADELSHYEILEEIFGELKGSSPFKSYNPEQGFTYLRDVINSISNLKKGGISPEEFQKIIEQNEEFLRKGSPLLDSIFAERISRKSIEDFQKFTAELSSWPLPPKVHSQYQTLQEIMVQSLQKAVEESLAGEKPSTKPITEWKNAHTKKNFKKQTIFKDFDQLTKQIELAKVYEQYQIKMHQRGLYDFADMLIDTVTAMEQHPELRYNLQERYLYVLVDEFQDTNAIQMRMLDNLLEAEVNEGRPNILAVGDDDQAIYKFQGANVENLLGFHEKFRDPTLIVLQKNYRSTQEILNLVRKIILTGENRLENLQPDVIKKELRAAGEAEQSAQKNGVIEEQEFPTAFHETVWIAEEIQKKLAAGTPVHEIAVIAPKHEILQQIAKILDYYKIPVAYSRKKNLLEQKHIKEILTILEFIDSLNQKGRDEADELMPEILAFPFWGLKRLDIWDISVKASRSRTKNLWLQMMLESAQEKIRTIAKFLINLAGVAKEKTAEEVIDYITGIQSLDIEEESKEDAGRLFESPQFTSPYKNFYFDAKQSFAPITHGAERSVSIINPVREANSIQAGSRSELHTEKFDHARTDYLEYLDSLKAFIKKIRDYKGSKALTVHHVVEFVELHQKHKLPIYHKEFFYNQEKAVNLLTAHSAKGLEFETVFVSNCQDETWLGKGMIDKLSFPSNIKLAAQADTRDDKLRLFYVSLTRAKKNLYLTHHQFKDNGDALSKLRFLEISEKPENTSLENIQNQKSTLAEEKKMIEFLELESTIQKHIPCNSEENELLKARLKNYKLSVTHLNNFLDVSRGGPQTFLEQNLLHFPQKQNASASYGTAMHKAVEQLLLEFKTTKKLPDVNFLLEQFEKSLQTQRLNKKDFAEKLEQGRENLIVYYQQRGEDFHPDDRSEFTFINQSVVIGSAQLNGKIDKMRFDQQSREITVYDYKTGKPFTTWQGRQEHEHNKIWRYKNQLLFYKLLVENSREFRGKYQVNTGVLEFLDPIHASDKSAREIVLLQLPINPEEVEELKTLAQIIYTKIMNLDFPDINRYTQDMFGVQNFIEDLLNRKI